MQRHSVLFVQPDYHCSFALRNEFRKIGWMADIYVSADFPERLLFESTGIVRDKRFEQQRLKWNYLVGAFNFVRFIWISRRFRYQIHYGALSHPIFIELPRLLKKVLGDEFHFGLWILRMMGKKIIYLPSGCRDEEVRSVFERFDNGSVCGNCGFSDRCHDSNIIPNLDRVSRYAHLSIGYGIFEPLYLKVQHFKYKSIDLDAWKPINDSSIQPVKKIRVLHSHSLESRSANGLNIKGSPVIVEIMRRIEAELPYVEFVEVTGLRIQDMVHEQQKADIVIDQLRYGWWGSTGVEALALGKVLVCYVRPSWETNFLSNFPEYNDLPVVNVNENNLYETMYELLSNHSRISELKIRSRAFAESHYDAKKNVFDLISVLQKL